VVRRLQYTHHWGLEKAKAHLVALGALESLWPTRDIKFVAQSPGHLPNMPPFDESTFGPMPKVDIYPKDEYWIDPPPISSPRVTFTDNLGRHGARTGSADRDLRGSTKHLSLSMVRKLHDNWHIPADVSIRDIKPRAKARERT
jgi:hypothetical protein